MSPSNLLPVEEINLKALALNTLNQINCPYWPVSGVCLCPVQCASLWSNGTGSTFIVTWTAPCYTVNSIKTGAKTRLLAMVPNISQSSVATRLRCGGFIMMNL